MDGVYWLERVGVVVGWWVGGMMGWWDDGMGGLMGWWVDDDVD